MSTTTTDIWGLQAAVGRLAPAGTWSIDAIASRTRAPHALKPMASATYEVHATNGFHRRPPGGST